MGDIESWNKAEASLKEILDEKYGDGNYEINEGDGAFYGPKIDLQMKDCLGREWQMGTIQLDFQLPLNFDLKYVAPDGSFKRPVMIHRAIFGSFERFIGILIENFKGQFPFWCSPYQVGIVPIMPAHNDYADEVLHVLRKAGIRAELDDRSEKIGYKIREAQMEKVCYMLIIGAKEEEAGTVNVRRRDSEGSESMKLDDFIAMIREEIDTKKA